MKRSFAVVRVGLVLALAQACAPSSSKQLAVRAVVDFEAATQVTHIGIYALQLAGDGTVRASWGEEREAVPDGPYAAPVDAWLDLDPKPGESLQITVVAYGPNWFGQVRAMAARQATFTTNGAPQWLRAELSLVDLGNVTDREPGLSLGRSRPPGELSFDPRARFTVEGQGAATAQTLRTAVLPEEVCVDATPCLALPPPESSFSPYVEVPPREVSAILVSGTGAEGCSFGTPSRSAPVSTPLVYWHGARRLVGDFLVEGNYVARLGRDYTTDANGTVAVTPALCGVPDDPYAAPNPRYYTLISVACAVSAESAPALCRPSATIRAPEQPGSKFVLPGREALPVPPPPPPDFSPIALSAPPTTLVVAGVSELLLGVGNAEQLTTRRSTWVAGSPSVQVTWGAAVAIALPSPLRALHAASAPNGPPRLYAASIDGTVRSVSPERTGAPLRFCATDEACAELVDVVGVVSATAVHPEGWVLREGSELSFYRRIDEERADRVSVGPIGDVSRVLEPLDRGADIAVVVQRGSGAWEHVTLDLASASLTVRALSGVDGMPFHAVQTGPGTEGVLEEPHVLTSTGEYRLVVEATRAMLVPYRRRTMASSAFFGRSASRGDWSEGGRESGTLEGTRFVSWYGSTVPEQVEESTFAAAYFGDFGARMIAGSEPGTYALALRYYGQFVEVP